MNRRGFFDRLLGAMALGSTAAFAGDRKIRFSIQAIDAEVLRRAFGKPEPRGFRVSWQESADGVTWVSGQICSNTQPGAIEGWREVVRRNDDLGVDMRDCLLEAV